MTLRFYPKHTFKAARRRVEKIKEKVKMCNFLASIDIEPGMQFHVEKFEQKNYGNQIEQQRESKTVNK